MMSKETHSGDVDVSHHERDDGVDVPERRSKSVALNIVENPLKVRHDSWQYTRPANLSYSANQLTMSFPMHAPLPTRTACPSMPNSSAEQLSLHEKWT